jgi:hypothetical protein
MWASDTRDDEESTEESDGVFEEGGRKVFAEGFGESAAHRGSAKGSGDSADGSGDEATYQRIARRS